MKALRLCILFLLLFLLTGCSLWEETVTVYCVDTATIVHVDGRQMLFSKYEYDSNGHLLQFNNTHEPKSYTYDSRGNVLSCTFHTSDGQPSHMRLYTYDKQDHVLSRQLADVAGNQYSNTVYTYDRKGNMISEHHYDEYNDLDYYIEMAYDAAGNRTQFIEYDQDGQEVYRATMTYDQNNRLIKSVQSPGSDILYTYDTAGNLVSDESYSKNGTLQHRTVYTCDKYGNLVEEKVVCPEDSLTQTVCVYDEAGNMLSCKETRSTGESFYEWTCDQLGNVLSYKLNENESMVYTYKCFRLPASQAAKIMAAQKHLILYREDCKIIPIIPHNYYLNNEYGFIFSY